jgi:nucleotide-binding universal stress UspA family protein
MLEFKRILSPIDFSKTSTHAFDYAVALAERLGAELQVVHVYQVPVYMMPEGVYEMPPDFGEEYLAKLEEQLKSFIQTRVSGKIPVSTRILEGVPYVEIVQYAKDVAADLIVIGTHGRAGLSHLLMGSVAERVVRTSDIPVVTIRLPE